MEFSKHITSSDGTQIWTQAVGDPSKPSIVFISGFMSSSSIIFNKQFEDPGLTNNLYLVRYDPRGCGLSGNPQKDTAWTPKKFSDDFKAVVEAYKLTKPFIAAWSYGGAIVADIMKEAGSDSYSGVIFLGSPPLPNWSADIKKPEFDKMRHLIVSSNSLDLRQTARDLVKNFTYKPVPHETELSWIGAYVLSLPYPLDRSKQEQALVEKAKEIWVLALLGKEDKFLEPEKVKELYEKTFRKEFVEVQIWSEVGHLPFYESPDDTRAAILAFVKRVNEAPPLLRGAEEDHEGCDRGDVDDSEAPSPLHHPPSNLDLPASGLEVGTQPNVSDDKKDDLPGSPDLPFFTPKLDLVDLV